MEEQDLPMQIIFGVWDPNYCVLLAFDIRLETAIEAGSVKADGTLVLKKLYVLQSLEI